MFSPGDQFNVWRPTVQLAIHGCSQLRINSIDQTKMVSIISLYNILPSQFPEKARISGSLLKLHSAHEPEYFLYPCGWESYQLFCQKACFFV